MPTNLQQNTLPEQAAEKEWIGTFSALFLIVFALIDFFAGFVYLFIGLGIDSMLGMMQIFVQQTSIELQQPATALSDWAMLGTGTALAALYGAFMLTSSGVLFAGGISLLEKRRPMLIMLAGILCLLLEGASTALWGVGPLSLLGLALALFVIWQARTLKQAQLRKPKQKPYSRGQQLLVLLMLGGLFLLIGFSALHLMARMRSYMQAELDAELLQPQVSASAIRVRVNSGAQTERPVLAQPDDAVQGRVQGQPFRLQQAYIEGDILTLRQGDDFFADSAVIIFLFNEHQLPQGQRYGTAGAATVTSPHVHLQWRENGSEQVPRSSAMTSGYQLDLEFAARQDETLPGSIRLTIADQDTEISGRFIAEIR